MNDEPTILLVDDNTNDILLFRFALGKSRFAADLRAVHSGLDAVKYLSGYGVYGNRAEFPMPGVVVLDLHMPGIDGIAVLRWIRRQRSLRDLPVVVFTGAECRREEALRYGADIYMRKGDDVAELLALLQQINLNWQRPQPARVFESTRTKQNEVLSPFEDRSKNNFVWNSRTQEESRFPF
jgi:CheY-like chemotaxis protein